MTTAARPAKIAGMYVPEQAIPLLTVYAIGIVVLSMPLMLAPVELRGWWWIALPVNLTCAYMIFRLAIVPTHPLGVWTTLAAASIWMAYYLWVFMADLKNEPDPPQTQPDDDRLILP